METCVVVSADMGVENALFSGEGGRDAKWSAVHDCYNARFVDSLLSLFRAAPPYAGAATVCSNTCYSLLFKKIN
jgi:hypothetical protein